MTRSGRKPQPKCEWDDRDLPDIGRRYLKEEKFCSERCKQKWSAYYDPQPPTPEELARRYRASDAGRFFVHEDLDDLLDAEDSRTLAHNFAGDLDEVRHCDDVSEWEEEWMRRTLEEKLYLRPGPIYRASVALGGLPLGFPTEYPRRKNALQPYAFDLRPALNREPGLSREPEPE